MDNDKIFFAYAFLLTSGVGSVIALSILGGLTTLPAFGVIVEHLALSLTFRGAYKSFGGFDWFFNFARASGFITMPEMGSEPVMAGAGI